MAGCGLGWWVVAEGSGLGDRIGNIPEWWVTFYAICAYYCVATLVQVAYCIRTENGQSIEAAHKGAKRNKSLS